METKTIVVLREYSAMVEERITFTVPADLDVSSLPDDPSLVILLEDMPGVVKDSSEEEIVSGSEGRPELTGIEVD